MSLTGSLKDKLSNMFSLNSDNNLCVNTCSEITNDSDNPVITSDILDTGGIDKVLSVTAGTPEELKVGVTVLAGRKYIVMEALDTGIKWGFSVTTQSFDLFKSQHIMIPVGDGTQIFFSSNAGTKSVAIAEIG